MPFHGAVQKLAVVIGASEWPNLGPEYETGHEAFVHSAQGFRDYLIDPGGLNISNQHVLWLFDDPGTSIQQLTEIRRYLSEHLTASGHRRGRSVWIFCYYVGHGAFAGRGSTYCLTIRATQPRPMTEDTSLRLPTLADVLREAAPESRQILILDSCFSAAAVRSFLGPLDQITSSKVRESVADSGVALLCASSASDVAMLAEDRTMFTSAMLDVLTAGEGDGDPSLSLRRVCELTYGRLRDLYGGEVSRPECHAPNQGRGDISAVPLFPNPAARRAQEATGLVSVPVATTSGHVATNLPPTPLAPSTTVLPLSTKSEDWMWKIPPGRDLVALLDLDFQRALSNLAPVRLGRMASSPSAFFRGAFVVMAHDLSFLPWSGITTRICGDTSTYNFTFTQTPDGRHTLDLADYGETVMGPWEYDLKRLLVSLALAAYASGLKNKPTIQILMNVLDAYRDMVRAIAARPALEQEYFSFDERLLEHLAVPDILAAYRQSTGRKAASLVHLHPNGQSLVDDPPVSQRVSGNERDFVEGLVQRYQDGVSVERRAFLSRFHVTDAISRISGVARIGWRDYVVLCRSIKGSDTLLLRAAEVREAAYALWLGPSGPQTLSDGARVVLGHRAAQALPDPLLSWVDLEDTSFVFRGLGTSKPMLDAGLDKRGLISLGLTLAAFLARIHIRNLEPQELLEAVAKNRAFQANLTAFALSYERQVCADHDALITAILAGRFPMAELTLP